jgi:Ca-activated chloride channel family protein
MMLLMLAAWLAAAVASAKPVSTLTGMVAAADGSPLIGAVVRLEATKLGALAKAPHGRFRIDGVRAGEYTATFDAIGYQTQTRRVSIESGVTCDVGTVVLAAAPRSAMEITVRGGRSEEQRLRVDGVEVGTAFAGGYGATSASGSIASAPKQKLIAMPSADDFANALRIAMPSRAVADTTGGRTANVTPTEDVSGEGYAPIYENEFLACHVSPISTFSIDVDRASYSNVRRFLDAGMLPPVDAVRIEEMVNYFDYDYPDPEDEHPFRILTELSDCPWDRTHRLVRVGLQGRRMEAGVRPPSNLTFLIDVSGSMADENKLPLLKKGLELLVDQMRPEDSVAIVVYAGAAGTVLPMTSGRDRRAIVEALGRLQAGGSTAGGEGINLAYAIARASFRKDCVNRVILATDGDFNVGVSSVEELGRLIEERRRDGIFLTVLGFGTGNYQDAAMEQLADRGNGNYAYVDNLDEARKVFVEELTATLVTIAKDVKIQIVFSPERVASYRLIGYENRMLATEDFDDDHKDAGELGAGHSVTALYEIVPRGSANGDLDGWVGRPDTLDMPDDWKAGEMMRVRLRYKLPDSDVSTLIEGPVIERGIGIDHASSDFRFAAAVAEMGLLLRNSRHKGTASYDDVLRLAATSKGADRNGHREEFVTLVGRARELGSREPAAPTALDER